MTTRGFSLVRLAALTAALGGCFAPAADSDSTPGEAIDAHGQTILNGTPATGFPEAVLVDIEQNGQTMMGCSGTLIAPHVVLTAAHCVADGDGWKIKAPYASGQTAHGSSAATYDWTSSNNMVSSTEHDVALVFLDSPITLPSYPTIATVGLAEQSQIVTVGRVKGGKLSSNALYKSQPVKVKSAASYGFKYDYAAPMAIEHGDSGGASYSAGTHTIVAVSSTGGGNTMLVARVDLVSSWIEQQIAANGGGGNGTGGGGDGGSGGGGGAGGAGTGGGSPNPPSSCAHSLCSVGAKLAQGCDPCATKICNHDPYCCGAKWDYTCVWEVQAICHESCGNAGDEATAEIDYR